MTTGKTLLLIDSLSEDWHCRHAELIDNETGMADPVTSYGMEGGDLRFDSNWHGEPTVFFEFEGRRFATVPREELTIEVVTFLD